MAKACDIFNIFQNIKRKEKKKKSKEVSFQWFSTGSDSLPNGNLIMPGDTFSRPNWGGGATGILWAEAKFANYPSWHRTALTTKNDLFPRVNSPEVEKHQIKIICWGFYVFLFILSCYTERA